MTKVTSLRRTMKMKKYWLMPFALLGLLILPQPAAVVAETPAAPPQHIETAAIQDLYYSRRDRKDVIITAGNIVPHSFYGLKIGDSKDTVLQTLRPAFKLMYELKAIGPAYLLSDVVYPDYYLTVQFNEKGQVYLIHYQKNQVYHVD